MGERKGGVDAVYEEVRARFPGAPPVDTAPPVALPVAPGIRVVALRTPTLPPALHTNVYLVGPDTGPVAVVDPGSPYPDQQAALTQILAPGGVSAVLLTHHHGDHIGGAVALAERFSAPIVAHPLTAALLAGVVDVTSFMVTGESRHGVVAIHTPGHAVGHLCFESSGTTIAGDMVAGLGTILIDPDEGDMAVYMASLERLLTRPAGAILPAHGPTITDGHAKLREYLAHRRMREERVFGALTAVPQALGDLVTIAYADTNPAMWRIAERSLLAHLLKLAGEGRAQDAGDGRWARYSARG